MAQGYTEAHEAGDTNSEQWFAHDLTTIHGAATQHSGLHLQVYPTEPCFRFTNDVWCELLRMRCGLLPSFQNRLQGHCHPGCGRDLHNAPEDPFHVMNCSKSGLFHYPHDASRNVLAAWLRQFLPELHVTKEAHLSDKPNPWRSDLLVSGFTHCKTPSFHIDLTGVSLHAAAHRKESIRGHPATSKKREEEKRKKYSTKIPADMTFVPLVIELPGGFGTEAKRFFSALAKEMKKRSGIKPSYPLTLLRSRLMCTYKKYHMLKVIKNAKSHLLPNHEADYGS